MFWEGARKLQTWQASDCWGTHCERMATWWRREVNRYESIATCVSVPLLLHNVAANVAEIKGMCCGQPLGHVSFSQHCVGSWSVWRRMKVLSWNSFQALALTPSSGMGRGTHAKICVEGMRHFSLGVDLFAASSMEIICHADRVGVWVSDWHVMGCDPT